MLFFRDVLEKRRKALGYTLADVGRLVGNVSSQSVQRWETGITCPKPQKIYKLAEVLECPVTDLSDLPPKNPDGTFTVIGNDNTIASHNTVQLASDTQDKFLDALRLFWQDFTDAQKADVVAYASKVASAQED